MITIKKERFIKFVSDSNGEKRSSVVAEIFVDTSDELPAANGIKGKLFLQGSSALIITENKIAVLSGDGKWYANGEVIK